MSIGLRAQPPVPRASALIVGQVVDAKDGRPIAGVTLTLTGGGPAVPSGAPGRGAASASPSRVPPQRVLADAEGRFVFSALPAGSFTLTANVSGYLPGAYGQTRPEGLSRPIVLEPDQKLGTVRITLWRFATLSGVVVDDGGEPVIGATVRAMRRMVNGRNVRLVSEGTGRTDDRGMYRISGLAPGGYFAMLPSSTTTMPASLVDLAVQAALANDGGAASRALSEQLSASNAPQPATGGVRVGNAYIQRGALFGASPVSPVARDEGAVFVQPALFFPGATTSASAAVLTLASGDDRAGVDFQLGPVRAFRVSGTIVSPDAKVGQLGVRLMPADLDSFMSEAGLETAATVTTTDGTFTFVGVPPGSYQLRVLRIPRPAGFPVGANPALPTMVNGVAIPRPQPPPEPTLFAQLSVTVAGADVANLSVPLRPGPRLSGRVQFDGASPKPGAGPAGQILITLSPADGRSISGGLTPAMAAADGQFTTMSMPPGRYLVTAAVPGWTLRSAIVDGRDAADSPLDLESRDVSGLTLTFFDRPSRVDGVVRTSSGEPDPAAAVVLFPADYRTWLQDGISPRRLRVVRPGTDGRFTAAGLLPGEYLIAAVADAMLDGLVTSATAIEAIAPLAARLSVREGARLTQELTTTRR